ncbi:hypothetical protein ACOQFV_27180 [Nocardiopsis changdeensis]|uniref:Uncharacterized protein n=1 Tax=Nocardiopsis changdeensis TaxID=2831969 RepID=A0ABX8BL53_9ACTN|nr:MULTISPECIES: hypothetical protein [Nocardiopsis]QUX22954.1 hypothetical protein KGD84_00640 [Nocardiopsis changdeensis]QYX38897.1 hypothetical protein K1J57_10090 [Nocardiopsis sp. MT53]
MNPPKTTLRTVIDLHRPLTLTALLCAAVLLVAVPGLLLDGRTVTGDPVWLKPAKFAVSIAVYNVTLAWLLSLLTAWRRTGWWLGAVVAVMVTGELVAITLQAVRGRASHFNNATEFDSAVYSLMASMIVTVWVATFAIGVILLVQRLGERSVTAAVRASLAIALAGMAVAFFMTSPTAEQMVTLQQGGSADVIGAHTVGMPDGGPGLPIVGWSTVAGDLRVAHFVGLHGLQVIVLFAFGLIALADRYPRLADDALRTRLVLVASGAYTGLLALLTWQALRGQSVVAPDALTLGAAAALAAATAAGAWWALGRREREHV